MELLKLRCFFCGTVYLSSKLDYLRGEIDSRSDSAFCIV